MAPYTNIRLNTAYNIRDLGGYAARGGKRTSGRILRGDCFAAMSEDDRRTLLGAGVKTVIDLRGEGERAKLPAGMFGCPGISYEAIPLIEEAANVTRGGIPPNFTMGDMYASLLDNAQEAVLAVFRHIARAASEPGRLLFHCAAGKDRTGVIAALLLALAGVSEQDIVWDYAQTEDNLSPVRGLLLKNSGIPSMMDALTDEFLSAKPRSMEKMLSHLHRTYGGAEGYFSEIGLTPAECAGVLTMMIPEENYNE
jgi:protein-tyrosine phosphatase